MKEYKEIREEYLQDTKEITPKGMFNNFILEITNDIDSYEFEFQLGLLFAECSKHRVTIEISIENFEIEEGDYQYYYNDGMQREMMSKFVPINEGHLSELSTDDIETYIDGEIGRLEIKLHKWDEV